MNCVSCVVIFLSFRLKWKRKFPIPAQWTPLLCSSNDNSLLLLLLLLQLMFKVPSISTHSQTSTPLIHCRADNVIQVAPLVYQSIEPEAPTFLISHFNEVWDHALLEFQLITSLNCNRSPDAKLLSTLFWSSLLITIFTRWGEYWQGVSKQYACVNWQCWRRQFSTIYKKQYLSNGQAIVVVKFHKNIANRWLFMIQRKIMTIILYS